MRNPDQYYIDEISKIDFDQQFPVRVKFQSLNGYTKWMDLNKESAKIIINTLKKHFYGNSKKSVSG